MRKFVLSVAAAGAAVIAATPAAAQNYPGQPAPYGNAYGYQNNWGQVRSLQARLNNVERQISRLDHRDRIGDRSADRLRDEANRIERKLREKSSCGNVRQTPTKKSDSTRRTAREGIGHAVGT